MKHIHVFKLNGHPGVTNRTNFKTIGKTKVIELSRISQEHKLSLHDLLEVTFHPDKNIAFRAPRILENLFTIIPLKYVPNIAYLLSRIKEVKHANCQRHYVKIIMHITNANVPQFITDALSAIDLEPVIEQCFDWMIDPKVKVAVKVFSGDVLFNLRHRYPWVKKELANQLKFLMQNGTAAMQSKRRRLLVNLVYL